MVADEQSGGIRSVKGIRAPAPDTIHLPGTLPDEPLYKIRPHQSWAAIDLREVWAHRELLLLLIWRDLKLRYKQTLLGALWVILQPLLLTLVFTTFVKLMGHPPTHNVPYSLFLYAGLLPWTFFSSAILASSYSLNSNAKLIRKIYFPRLILPAAAIGVRLSDFSITFMAVIALMFYYGVYPSLSILILPLIILNLVLLALGIGTWFSALNIRYGDVGTALPVLLQVWMFASPIIYPSSLVPQKWRWVYYLNPLAGIIEGFRAALFNLEFNRSSLLISLSVTLVLLVFVSYSFRRMEDGFADLI